MKRLGAHNLGGKKMVSNPNLTTLGVGVRYTDCQQR